MKPTRFSVVYDSFLSKITDDMYLQLTEEDTKNLLRELLMSAIPKFEFPRQNLSYEYRVEFKDEEKYKYKVIWENFAGFESYDITGDADLQDKEILFEGWTFKYHLNLEEINVLSTYMIVEWLGQQLASVENVRMKYSGPDFKFTSQANHMQKLLQMKKDYEREGFHLQRLYKRRILDVNGIYHSTMPKIMEDLSPFSTKIIQDMNEEKGYDNIQWERVP